MAKVAVVYWSGTGNTEAMAKSVVEGAKEKGLEVDLIYCDDFSSAKVDDYDAIAFGCPAMGDEVLEESSFEPMFTELEGKLKGKKIALFGSHEWNEEGKWMDDWEDRVIKLGATLVYDPIKSYGAPDGDVSDKCKELGKALTN